MISRLGLIPPARARFSGTGALHIISLKPRKVTFFWMKLASTIMVRFQRFCAVGAMGKIGWHLKLNFAYDDLEIGPLLIFSRDGRWIYFARDKSIWRVGMPKFN